MTSPETGRGNDQPRPDSTPPSPDPQTSQWTPPPAPSAPLPPIGTAPESYGWNPPAPPPETRRRGWLLPVAGLVLLLIVAAIGVYVFLNQGRTTGPDAARAGYAYLPADSAMAMELRLDLPAGQREQFVRFATRFPQFGDAGQVERQMDQLLNEAIATASGGMANYEDDVKPWFAGWIVAGGSMPAEVGAPPPFVVILGSTNRPAAEVAVERLRGAWELPTALAFLAWFVFAPQCLSTLAVARRETNGWNCLLYTSDAADDSLRVDLGGRRIIKKKK